LRTRTEKERSATLASGVTIRSLLPRAERPWRNRRGEARGTKEGRYHRGGKPVGGVQGKSKQNDKKTTETRKRRWEKEGKTREKVNEGKEGKKNQEKKKEEKYTA
jgi:hypothetical protein